jgi:hypothetical protein
VLAAAAPHSARDSACHIEAEFIKSAKKYFWRSANQRDCERSKREFLTQKDRKRHCRSDKFRQGHKKVVQPQKGTKSTKGKL